MSTQILNPLKPGLHKQSNRNHKNETQNETNKAFLRQNAILSKITQNKPALAQHPFTCKFCLCSCSHLLWEISS